MPLVDDADVQVHLPYDKLKIETIPDDLAKCKLDAERVVRGALSDVVEAAVLASWAEPEDTPEIIRAITGRLCAAQIYRVRYSENNLNDPQYAQTLYDQAMAMLLEIENGDILLPDVVLDTDFDNTWFEPNNNSDPPKFTMADRY